MVRKSAFRKPLINLVKLFVTFSRLVHVQVTQKLVSQVLITQAVTKAPRSNKINFRILQII